MNLLTEIRKIAGKSILGFSLIAIACHAKNNDLVVEHLGDNKSMIRVNGKEKYLLLPVEDASPEVRIQLVSNNTTLQTLHVRLAVNKPDYYVPVDISEYSNLLLTLHGVPEKSACWENINLANEFDTRNNEYHRPDYHFSPAYGWMNDPNGMVYKDGEYHLFYQYNPYGSTWGNMHWGHAVSKDLLAWEHLPVALAPDGLGSIFSGSCVVDEENCSGFGKGAIVAFYTSAGERQTQSIAYSNDNGRTFSKYEKNPVLTSTVPDFRDPKVFRHAPSGKWMMILAAGQEMQLFSSANLRDWAYESSFGHGEGAHGGVWECPDLIELPVEGTNEKKWVLICNLNPGGPFGGSATQYFVGNFDGKRFVNEFPGTTKWMDYGKDHYAAVTWSNAPQNRNVAIAWMSNWEYANQVPTAQYRSANSVPRDLSLFRSGNDVLVKSAPSPELISLRTNSNDVPAFNVKDIHNIDALLPDNNGAYEIEMTIRNQGAEVIGWQLFNAKGEEVKMHYNLIEQVFSADRTRSGKVDFSPQFPAITTTPVHQRSDLMKIRIFVDKNSMEIFGQDGQFALTNLIFPTEPYNRMSFYAKGGSYAISDLKIYSLTK